MLYSTLYVNSSGHISFDEPVSLFHPQLFPRPYLQMLTRDPQVVDRFGTEYVSRDSNLVTDLIESVMNSSQLTLSSFTPHSNMGSCGVLRLPDRQDKYIPVYSGSRQCHLIIM